MAFRVSTVLKAIGESRLALYPGNGYWYFAFDDKARNIYETEMVYVMRLSDMGLARWVEEGRDFCQKTLAKADSRDERAAEQTFITKLKGNEGAQ